VCHRQQSGSLPLAVLWGYLGDLAAGTYATSGNWWFVEADGYCGGSRTSSNCREVTYCRVWLVLSRACLCQKPCSGGGRSMKSPGADEECSLHNIRDGRVICNGGLNYVNMAGCRKHVALIGHSCHLKGHFLKCLP